MHRAHDKTAYRETYILKAILDGVLRKEQLDGVGGQGDMAALWEHRIVGDDGA